MMGLRETLMKNNMILRLHDKSTKMNISIITIKRMTAVLTRKRQLKLTIMTIPFGKCPSSSK